MPAARQKLAVAVLDRLGKAEVVDAPAVEIDVDPRPVAPRPFGSRRHRRHLQAVAAALKAREVGRVQSGGGGRPVDRRRGRQRQRPLAIDRELEADAGVWQRLLDQRAPAQRRLRAAALEKAPPRRQLEEQRRHLHGGAGHAGARPHRLDPAEADRHAVSGRPIRPPRGDRQHAAGADAGQRLTAKPQRAHPREVLVAGDLRRGVAHGAQPQVLRIHAGAVIDHADALQSPLDDLYPHVPGPGVDGVVEQLANDRVRPIDHFAGGDLPGGLLGEDADAAHAATLRRCGRACAAGIESERLDPAFHGRRAD